MRPRDKAYLPKKIKKAISQNREIEREVRKNLRDPTDLIVARKR